MRLPAESRLRRNLEIPWKIAALAFLVAACAPASPPAAAGNLQLVWRVHLDGAVDGSPAIAAGMVFAGTAGGDLAALDSITGARRWLRSGLGAISDSPAVDGGRVFAGTLSGHVLAFRAADGTPLWDWKGPPDASIWSSAVVYRGVVVVGVASPYGDQPLVPGRIVGLDASTGKERWSTCLLPGCTPGDGVWSTPAVDAGGAAFVGVGNPGDGVLAFDPLTGRVRWLESFYPDGGRDLDVGARPLIVMSAGRELVIEPSVEGTVVALDATTGSVVWSRKLVEGSAVHGLIASPAYDGVNLYVASAGAPSGVFALQPADGSVAWRHATDEPVYSAPAVRGGVVVFGTGAVFGDRGAGSLVALSTRDGSELGRLDLHSAVRSGPALEDGLAVFGDYAGDVMAVRVSSRR
jgi:outer membrane protein assembly factor BamB